MKRLFLIIIIILTGGWQILFCQKKWTLQDCIMYAVSNNLDLQRQRLQTENSRVNLTKSKLDLLPSLNFQSDGRVGFGRSIDPVTNLITFNQNISNSYSVSSNIDLFTGFATVNSIAANKFMLQAGLEIEKVATNTLVINILNAYYLVLYARGLEEAARLQLELSEKQLFRIKKNVEAGRESLSKQFEMESKVSEDRLAYTVAVNTSSQAVTTLKQALQLEPGTEFDIALPDLSVPASDAKFNTDSIFRIASEVLPRLKAINYQIKASSKQVASLRGAVLPRLTLGGALFTGFYKVIAEGAGGQDSFKAQINKNYSQAVYMSLQVPLFNNYTTARSIRQAKILENDNKLKLELEKNSLYTDIENACLNYNSGRDEYSAAVSNLEFNNKSFEVVEKKFEAGLVDVTDYSAASTTLFRAQSEDLRTKLQLMIRRLTLELYTTGEYDKMIYNK